MFNIIFYEHIKNICITLDINPNIIHYVEYSIKVYHNKFNHNRTNLGFFKNKLEKNKLYLLVNNIFHNKDVINFLDVYYDQMNYIMFGIDNNDLEIYCQIFYDGYTQCIAYDIGKNMIKKYNEIYNFDEKKLVFYTIRKYLGKTVFKTFRNIFNSLNNIFIHKIQSDKHIFAYIFRLPYIILIKEKINHIIAFLSFINYNTEIFKFIHNSSNMFLANLFIGFTIDNKLECTIYVRYPNFQVSI